MYSMCVCVDRGVNYLRHSGSIHFSTCSNSSVHSPSSTGDLSMRCRVLKPFPQVTLQSLQSDHGVSMQGIVSIHNTSHSLTHSVQMCISISKTCICLQLIKSLFERTLRIFWKGNEREIKFPSVSLQLGHRPLLPGCIIRQFLSRFEV